MIHRDKHPDAGKVFRVKDFVDPDENEEIIFRLEDWYDRVTGKSWGVANNDIAAVNYAVRIAGTAYPLDDEVVYGRSLATAFGHIVHVMELKEV